MNSCEERKAFEAEHKKLHPQVTIRQQNLIGTYTDQYVDHAAFWFQAGAAYQRSIDKGLVEALEALIADYDGEVHNEYDGTNMLDDRLAEINYAREALATYRAAQGEKP